eukprot:GILJ01007917.1.p1 GENE.GILJ01007917.1~~GILJ01007917.1.p1  ORF type:complete len:207 (-),score=24.94 GILJ01007917.1:228-848(-)
MSLFVRSVLLLQLLSGLCLVPFTASRELTPQEKDKMANLMSQVGDITVSRVERILSKTSPPKDDSLVALSGLRDAIFQRHKGTTIQATFKSLMKEFDENTNQQISTAELRELCTKLYKELPEGVLYQMFGIMDENVDGQIDEQELTIFLLDSSSRNSFLSRLKPHLSSLGALLLVVVVLYKAWKRYRKHEPIPAAETSDTAQKKND